MKKMVGNKTTYDYQLKKAGIKLFGRKFEGVYAADTFPVDIPRGHCFIVNVDTSDEPGEHWLSVCKQNDSNVFWVYDSFARSIHQIFPNIYNTGNRIKTTERDVEQSISEDNCGARALAFIDVFMKLGPQYAKMI